MSRKKGSRDTRWPELNHGEDETRSTDVLGKPPSNEQRNTVFPGGFDIIKLQSQGSLEVPTAEREKRDASKYIPPKIPLALGSETQTKGPKKRTPKNHWAEDPWDTYKSLRSLDRGGIVTAAYTRKAPVQMVVIKELRSVLCATELEWSCHHNLVAVLQLYQFEEKWLAVMEYTVATLQQVMAVLPLKEIHISALFEGIRHLSRNGVVHSNLNTSKVLFTQDGCVKIAFLDDYQVSASTRARPLGVIAIEMMQNGLSPGPGSGLILRHPDLWSAEAANFLSVASWGSLQDLKNVRHPASVTGLC
ncbi:hypothetical protein V493_01463 [Pseudogymnoascus sp. VKM F-4281 (FW-2241)]|nr:hypothetical protein V493_01463 [Pseudogymnoascus sp. VKM F-4281 (FW-2241)]